VAEFVAAASCACQAVSGSKEYLIKLAKLKVME
jgi:hypothetical protein